MKSRNQSVRGQMKEILFKMNVHESYRWDIRENEPMARYRAAYSSLKAQEKNLYDKLFTCNYNKEKTTFTVTRLK